MGFPWSRSWGAMRLPPPHSLNRGPPCILLTHYLSTHTCWTTHKTTVQVDRTSWNSQLTQLPPHAENIRKRIAANMSLTKPWREAFGQSRTSHTPNQQTSLMMIKRKSETRKLTHMNKTTNTNTSTSNNISKTQDSPGTRELLKT